MNFPATRRLCLALSAAALCVFIVHCSGATSSAQGTLDSPGTDAVPAVGWDVLKMVAYNYADTDLDSLGHFKTVPNGCHQDAAGAIDLALWNRIAPLVNKAVSLPPLDDQNEICFDRSDDSKLFGTVDVVLSVPSTPGALTAASSSMRMMPTPAFSWPFPWPWERHTPDPTPTAQPIPAPTIAPRPMPAPTSFPAPISSTSVAATPSPSPSGITRTILENRGAQICASFNDLQTARDLAAILDQVAAIAYKEDCERVP